MRARIAIVSLTAGAALLAAAGTASATPQPSVHAVTHVTDRPDGGNGGTWADDSMTRAVTITLTGGSPGAYTFTATLKDKGSFTAIKGAKTPNQGGSYAGDTIKSAVTGRMAGYADFSFTASALPSTAPNAGVPAAENDHGATPADSTSTWYELAFPAGTHFGGAGIGAWSWTYKATVVTVTSQLVCLAPHFCWPVPVVHVSHQQWVDAWNNGDGNLPADGNIPADRFRVRKASRPPSRRTAAAGQSRGTGEPSGGRLRVMSVPSVRPLVRAGPGAPLRVDQPAYVARRRHDRR